MLKIAYSPVYKYSLPPGHRFPMDKYELLPQQLLYEGLITDENFFHPEKLGDDEILLTHDEFYLDRLNTNTLAKKAARKIGFPILPSLIERGKHISCGTYQCALNAKEYGVSLNIAGGTHHAYADRGEGFCVFNDIAIASNLLLERNEAEQVLIVDLDVHQGNGTAHIFKEEEKVFTFSMHGAKNFPLKKEASDLDIPLEDGTEDRSYLESLKSTLPQLINRLKPDLIFYLSGADVLESDRLGRLSLSRQGCAERDRYVFEVAYDNAIPVAVSMGGGYSPQIRDIIEGHANTFRSAKDVFNL